MARWLGLLLILSVAASAQDEPWTLRYTNFDNITPDQRQAGATPDFAFTDQLAEGHRVLSLQDDEQGQRIGQVYLGRPIELGDPRPKTLLVSFELQADCNAPNRTPGIRVMLLTQEGWELLNTDPAAAQAIPRWSREQKVADQGVDHPEDALDWTPWRSSNLAPKLTARTPDQLWLVISFSGNHLGNVEFAKFRDVEVTMSQTPPPVEYRKPVGPLKSSRGLRTDAEIAIARQRCAESDDAAALRDGILARADRWVEMPEEDLLWRLPDASVPRAFNVSVDGCPVHGKKIYEHGTYPWILDFDKPFTIECPVGHETYPGNDFLKWYQSQYQDKSALQGEYRDDGWGWVNPKNDERYWLIAYANHWTWSKYTLPGIVGLAQAYQLTGDRKYADRCAAMLARVADIYPGMDYEAQSRYGTLNPGYSGKILNHIWETGTIANLAEAYDAVWETIDSNTALLDERHQTGEELRSHIEANVLEEGIAGILDGHIVGNFGMHQRALAILVAVRQPQNARELLSIILDKTGAEGPYEGIRYALYNWVHRDGVPYETSPGYNFSWVANLTETAALVDKAGENLFTEPKFKLLLSWPIELLVNGHTPAVGDAGNLYHGKVGITSPAYREAFRRYGGSAFAWALQQSGIEDRDFSRADDLFEPELAADVKAQLAAHPLTKPVSRVLDGYGMVLLNNPNDSLGVQNYYGYRGGHSHRDGLTFDLYANGLAVTPDTGYPDFMNSFVSGIYTWSKATISHNTVTIDSQQQTGNQGGQVHHFAHTADVQYSDVSAPGNYPVAEVYRRALALISTGDDAGYLIDVFRVAGGSQHDYSLHGTVGVRTIVEGQFSAPQTKGTLAGEDVAVGQIYDDPAMGAPDYHGGYGGYHGSGFQHLTAVQRQQGAGPVTLQVDAEAEPKVNLRLHLTSQEGQQAILAEAQVSPLKRPEKIPFLIARRTGDAGLQSTFVSVLEPFTDTPFIKLVERLPVDGDAVAVRITHAGGVDLVLQAPDAGTARTVGELSSDGALTILRSDADGRPVRLITVGATTVSVGGKPVPVSAPVHGKVSAVDLEADAVTVAWDGDAPADLVGQTIRLGDGDARLSSHTIATAEAADRGQRLGLQASLTNGLARVTGIDDAARTLRTDSRLHFEALYDGMWAVPEGDQSWLPIGQCGGGQFTLGGEEPLAERFSDQNGDGTKQFRVSVAAPGQAVVWEPAVSINLPE